MCGIAGIYNLNNEPISGGRLKHMIASLRHRGPDGEGFVLFQAKCIGPRSKNLEFKCADELSATGQELLDYNIGFGHCRLAIIDLTEAGHQPMCNEDATIWITFNGEIYNYTELRHELIARGHSFKSRTDTEVIIHAYEEWGVDCLTRFNGMWAFAIWDEPRKRLFCARDRMGIKPFYYYFDKERFIFASEIKAILANSAIKRIVNDQTVWDYLALGYLDHTENTFFAGIKQLLPAHYLLIENKDLSIHRYWDLDPNITLSNITDAEAAKRFYELFEDSIRLHLQSDVPVGSCLSGGLDSSSIVCLANKLLPGNGAAGKELIGEWQKTFSSCFEDKRFDERDFIQEIVKQTKVEAKYVFPDDNKLFEEFPRFIWHQDEPVNGTSQYAQWCVMRLAMENGVKVLLDGQGSDETLAGYHLFYPSYLSDLAEELQISRYWHESRWFNRIHSYQPARRMWLMELIRPLVPKSILVGRETKRSRFVNLGLDWLDDDFLSTKKDEVTFRQHYSGKLIQHLYRFLTQERLPSLLRYEDKSSMAFSIEARVPFLDYRLIEYVFSLPSEQKLRKGMTKVVLRNAMKGILPEKVRQRVDKMGFVTPEATWFRTGCKDKINQIIHSDSFRGRGYFNAKKVKKRFNRFCAEQENDSGLFWRCINMELWLKVFFN